MEAVGKDCERIAVINDAGKLQEDADAEEGQGAVEPACTQEDQDTEPA